MGEDKGANRLYGDLAWLWPLWGGPGEYGAESEMFAGRIRSHAGIEVRTLLDVGCGGGKNAFHLKKHFAVTGVDLSEAMLAHARALNPECEFVRGDMRALDLGRQFDAVFLNDAVSYMTTRGDLLAAFRSAFAHLRGGGVMVTYPDELAEHFRNTTCVSDSGPQSAPDDPYVVFVENNYDPDPDDETYETTFVYLIREKGVLRIEHDHHVLGLFPLAAWREALQEAGFEVRQEAWDAALREDPQFSRVKDLPVFSCIKPM